eukprot:Filipodium_phascolosomae@DN2297_c0_g1_i1.p1
MHYVKSIGYNTRARRIKSCPRKHLKKTDPELTRGKIDDFLKNCRVGIEAKLGKYICSRPKKKLVISDTLNDFLIMVDACSGWVDATPAKSITPRILPKASSKLSARDIATAVTEGAIDEDDGNEYYVYRPETISALDGHTIGPCRVVNKEGYEWTLRTHEGSLIRAPPRYRAMLVDSVSDSLDDECPMYSALDT